MKELEEFPTSRTGIFVFFSPHTVKKRADLSNLFSSCKLLIYRVKIMIQVS